MSNLSLIPVTSKNRRAIEKLKVFPHQTGFIESVADCMKERFYHVRNDSGARLYKTLV